MRRWSTLILLAAAIMAPSILLGSGSSDSWTYNYVWTRQFAEAMAAGEFYPRWLPDSFEGLGSATFYFYPPLAFWLSGGLDALGLTTQQAISAAGFVLLLASGLAMYAWLSWRGTRPLLGAGLYMLAPYHLVDFYTRGALGEFAAFVWLPLIALGIEALPRRWAIPLLAVSFAGLILSHLPMAMLVSLFLCAPLAIHRAWRDRSVIVPGLVAAALGVGLAAFYLLPALSLLEHVSVDLLWGHYYQPSSWFVWKTTITIYLLTLPPIALAMAVLAWPARSIWTAITLVAGAAALGLIPFIWDIPLLAKAQFPWRLLCVVEFAAITALAAHPPRRLLLAIAGALLFVPVVTNGARTVAVLKREPDYADVARTMPDAPEYLPRGFDVSAITDLKRRIEVSQFRDLPAATTVTVERAGPVTLRRANFPIWRVEKDGVRVPTRGPLITFDAAPGTYRVVRVTLWQEWAGGLVSLAALVLLALAWRLPAPAGRAAAPRRRRTAATQS